MPATQSKRNKRRSTKADSDFEPEVPQAKKQINSYEDGTPVNGKKIRHKNNSVDDLEVIYAVPRKLVCRDQEDGFPRFHHGTVYIQLIELDPKYTYIFEKDIIARSSEVLRDCMRVRIAESDKGLAETIKHRAGLEYFFDLRYIQSTDIWALVRLPFTFIKSPEKQERKISTPVQPVTETAEAEAPNLQLPPTPKSVRSSVQAEVQPAGEKPPSPSKVDTGEARCSSSKPAALAALESDSGGLRTADENSTARASYAATGEQQLKENEAGMKVEENQVKQEIEETKQAIKEEDRCSIVATTGVDVAGLESGLKDAVDDTPIIASSSTIRDPAKGKVINSGVVTKAAVPCTESVVEEKVDGIARLTCNNFRYAHGEIPSSPRVGKDATSKVVVNSDEGRLAAVEAHHNLLLIFHNMTPDLDNNNIDIALEQIEQITRIATRHKCVPLVRHQLANHIFQFGRDLFKAILQDPPRWLVLSNRLQCAPIFKEALIHMVGYYPHYPWTEIPCSKLPQAILDLIRKKVEEIKALRNAINAELFKSTIDVSDGMLTFHNLEKSNFDTWFVVQLWQDWFRKSMCMHDTAKYDVGTSYRLMAKGGDAYLEPYTIYSKLLAYKGKNFGSWNLKSVQEDLKTMKEFAQREVKDLVINNSMLDVEESGIRHLTCTRIENYELPWVNNA